MRKKWITVIEEGHTDTRLRQWNKIKGILWHLPLIVENKRTSPRPLIKKFWGRNSVSPGSRHSAAVTGQYLTLMDNEEVQKTGKVWNLWESKICRSFSQVRVENSSLVKSRLRTTTLRTCVSTRNKALGENQWWACDSLARDFQGSFEEWGKKGIGTGLWVLLHWKRMKLKYPEGDDNAMLRSSIVWDTRFRLKAEKTMKSHRTHDKACSGKKAVIQTDKKRSLMLRWCSCPIISYILSAFLRSLVRSRTEQVLGRH